MSTIVVSGAVANKYGNGGAVWTRLSYALGFKKLGCDVYFLEQIEPEKCVGPDGAVTAFECSVNLDYFRKTMDRFGLSGSAALICGTCKQTYGLTRDALLDLCDGADLLVNISGHLTLQPFKQRFRRKVFIDQDPGFTQYWHEAGHAEENLTGHEFYFTVGENIGAPDCPIPTGGVRWRPTRQPAVLDEWPVCRSLVLDRFTTVARWRGSYGPVRHGGKTLGLKVHEFRKFIDLPRRSKQSFEIALDIDPADSEDRRSLLAHGWQIVDPRINAPDPCAFRRYVQTSGAEFSVAQGIYVATGSGWFSDRSVRYLASGKPVLLQDTGFSRNYPVGEGLISFRSPDEAAAGAENIARDYDRHSRAARVLAESYFDSSKVLGSLLEEVGVSPYSRSSRAATNIEKTESRPRQRARRRGN